MFVNQVLFRYENFASILFDSLEGKNVVKILDLSEMLTSANFFVKFHCFHKNITKGMFPPPPPKH